MPFIIDGYNLVHAMGLLGGSVGPHQLAKARAGLLGLLSTVHTDDTATVVFDARRAPPGVDTQEVHGAVRVEFAMTEEADDRIEWLIAHDPAPKRLVVVSDDHRLQNAAKHRGCSAWKCDAYLAWLQRERHKRRGGPTPEKPAGVGPMETDRWLATFADLDHDPEWNELFGSSEEEK